MTVANACTQTPGHSFTSAVLVNESSKPNRKQRKINDVNDVVNMVVIITEKYSVSSLFLLVRFDECHCHMLHIQLSLIEIRTIEAGIM